MATYSNLGIKLITTGDESGTWGTSTNTNFSDVIDEAIAGVVTYNIGSDANFTLTVSDATSSDARHAVIKFTSTTLTATRTCTLAPDDLQKVWVVVNATTGGQSLTFKQGSSGATVTVPNGESAIIYSDGAGASAGAITRVLDSFTNTKVTTGTLSTSGNLTFSSTAQRITGDMSTATFSNRLAFQTSTANSATSISSLPNGTGTASNINCYNNSDPTNSSLLLAGTNATEALIQSAIRGTGSYLPMTFYTGGSERMRLDTSGNLGIGATPSYRLDVQGGTASFTGSSGANAIRVAGAGGSWFWIDNPTTTTMRFSSGATAGTGAMVLDSSGNVGIGTASPASKLDVSGIIRDSAGNVRAIPPVGTKTGSYTLATGDVGKYVQVGSGGSITIPDATFAEGDVVSIFNNTSGNITITCSITTAYIAGTDADKATMTLATRGVATVLFISSTVCVVNGNVS